MIYLLDDQQEIYIILKQVVRTGNWRPEKKERTVKVTAPILQITHILLRQNINTLIAKEQVDGILSLGSNPRQGADPTHSVCCVYCSEAERGERKAETKLVVAEESDLSLAGCW